MDYEKKYKEALERAKRFYNDEQVRVGMTPIELENIFPELKENGDEKIRKELISFVENWKVYNPNSPFADYPIYTSDKKKIDNILSWLEKQGEQNPTDKVEPRFKGGDWISNGRYTKLIVGINSDWPHYMFNDGTSERIKDIDKKYHLWTIEDAKPGDVLAAHECLVLFREIDGLNIKCYCTYHYLNHQKYYVDTLQNKTAFCPATKEQRDLLFQKMNEAGYTFDFKKKELKRIESKPAIEMKTPEESLGIDSDTYNKIVDECIYGEQKPAWSEEDEKILNTTISFLSEYAAKGYENAVMCIDWLESLKDRMKGE